MPPAIRRFTTPQGRTLAYRALPGAAPGVVFLHGLFSDMNGAKALALEEHCARQGRAFLRFDLSGHGASSGRAEGIVYDGASIAAWREDTLAALDALTQGAQILAGSSLGGWLMTLAAVARPQRVAGLLGIAAAPDFTLELTGERLTKSQQARLARGESVVVRLGPHAPPCRISQETLESCKPWRVLGGAALPVRCPVRLLHGEADEEVPWRFSLRLMKALAASDATLTLIKGSGHRLSKEHELPLILEALDSLLVVVPRRPPSPALMPRDRRGSGDSAGERPTPP